MHNLKLCLATVALAIYGAAYGAASASAQIQTYYSPVYGAPVYGQGPIVYAPPIVVARPMGVVPPLPIVTAYRPIAPTYVAPGAVYSAYRPAYPAAPVTVYAPATLVAPPVYGAAVRFRAGYVGRGLGGVPSVYTPGQPVRNAIRYVVP